MNMKKFFKDTAERAIKTAAQTAITLLIIYHGIVEVDWGHVIVGVALAVVISVLTSFSSFCFGNIGTACALKLYEEDSNNGNK